MRRPAVADAGAVAGLKRSVGARPRTAIRTSPRTPSARSGPCRASTSDHDAWLVEDGSGAPVAYGLCWVETPPGEIVAEQAVDPAARGRGLSELPARTLRGARGRDRRSRARGRRQPLRVVPRDRRARIALYERRGFAHVSTFLRLDRDLDDTLDPPEWPAGIRVAAFRPGADDAAVYAAHEEGFADHPGYGETDLEEWLASHFAHESPDLGLWLVAWDGDEVVGGIEAMETPAGAYMGELFVRGAWRGRGIARALMLAGVRGAAPARRATRVLRRGRRQRDGSAAAARVPRLPARGAAARCSSRSSSEPGERTAPGTAHVRTARPVLQSAGVRRRQEAHDHLASHSSSRKHGYLLAVVAIALSTLVFRLGRDQFAKGQWALLYLLVILLVASAAGPGPAVLAAVLAFFAWNFFFLPPYHTLEIHDPKDWLSLVAFLVVGVLVGALAGRMRDREARARAREQESAALNRLSAAVVSQTSTGQMAETLPGRDRRPARRRLGGALSWRRGGELVSYRRRRPGRTSTRRRGASTPLASVSAPHDGATRSGSSRGRRRRPVRAGAQPLGRHRRPHRAGARATGAPTPPPTRGWSRRSATWWARSSSASGCSGAATAAAAAREADNLKSSLLSSVSHELKTPLAALTATVSNLLESDVDWDEESVRDELRAIVGDVARLNNSITPCSSCRGWRPTPGSRGASSTGSPRSSSPAWTRCRCTCRSACAWTCRTRTLVVNVDFVQFTRVIQSLLENALLYTDSAVTIGAHGWNEGVRLWVEDQGPGIPADEHEAVFEKFFRGRKPAGQRGPSGTGLGLAIAREIVLGHGGTIVVDDVVPARRAVRDHPGDRPRAGRDGE